MVPDILRHPKVRLTAAATRNKERLEKIAYEYNVETYYTIEDLCKSTNVDAVYIATPTELHTEHVRIAAEAKKHIIVEKPLSVSLTDADNMIENAERNGVQLIVGHSHSFEPPIQKMREIITSGELGRVVMIHNWYFNDWLYRPRTPEELKTELGGGVTYRQGSHQFDIIRFLGGGMIRSIRAVTGIWDDSRPTEGNHSIFLEFENGTAATAVYNGYDHFHTTELTFDIGEGGPLTKSNIYAQSRRLITETNSPADEVSLKIASGYGGSRSKNYQVAEKNHPFFGLTIVSCEKGDIRQHPDGLLVYGENEKYVVPISKEETGRFNVIDELCTAVIEGQRPVHDGYWAKANLEVCIKAIQSSKERKELYLDFQVPVKDKVKNIIG
ncbi:gfo/Idh/MocA family oxidoreductase [Bacillus canaveralius]|uniref:Gfo/Idh/MocA family oxidoreductase n=2 Tax=Bacillus canaveralius TaxID=1403243 RepID=A0A2N5GMS9_9BACI|nr:gfo/Idh/MocA family oxidoreductase [Bacillus canaveralius]PLR96699.1 gfo/Idh/MocA family oxidoreductase [Bacillus canaveralius]RSK55318.1 Gfo/Idh/MocA family oxidoreductase [Bacillus canaveralius]